MESKNILFTLPKHLVYTSQTPCLRSENKGVCFSTFVTSYHIHKILLYPIEHHYAEKQDDDGEYGTVEKIRPVENADTRKAVEIIAGRYETESSGGITFDTLRQYGECGVDYISVGALTHSVKGLDMSFKAC